MLWYIEHCGQKFIDNHWLKEYIKIMKCCLRGFTLAELMIIVFIVAILTAMAIPGFNKAMENAREKEAKSALELIYRAQRSYRLDQGTYASAFSGGFAAYVDNPNNQEAYYTYELSNVTATTFTATATRKPGAPSKVFTIDQTGIIT